jgi:DNA-binding transcriptional LysR family regulator
MPDMHLDDVAAFVRVVDRGGFAPVARALKVPTSTVSRAVARLEETLGTRLVQRTTRSVRATHEGRAFYDEVAPAIAALHHAARGVEETERLPRGRLRVTAPNDLGTTFLAAAVVEFTRRHPRVEVELVLTGRMVNLVEEGIDIALRAGKLADSSLVAKKLGDGPLELYASVAYAQTRGIPASLEDLAQHDIVNFRPRDGVTRWTLQGPDGEVEVELRGRIGADDFLSVRAAIRAGGGIGLLSRFISEPDLTDGVLMRVLPAYHVAGAPLHVVHASSRNVPARVTAFRDFIIEAFARYQMPATPRAVDRAVRKRSKR